MSFSRERWISLFAAMVAAIFAGYSYSWSVYVNPLSQKYLWTTGAISIAYTLFMVLSAVFPIVLMRLRSKLKISQYILVGAIMYSAGLILSGFIQSSIYELYLYLGVLAGGGAGIIYVSLASYVVQLFPDKRGLAAGLYTACFSVGAFFWAPTASSITIATGDVSLAFRYLGFLFFVVIAISSRFMYEIPEGYAGEAINEVTVKKAAPVIVAVTETRTIDLFKSPIFYVVWIMYVCGLISGLMILSLGSPIVQGSLGYSAAQAAVVVGLFALASTFGRLFWGWASDKIGRMNVLTTIGGLTCLSMWVLSTIKTEFIFFIAILVVPMCYGAYASTLSPTVVETFGIKYFTGNYNILYTAFAFAAMIGPQVITYIKVSSGGYQGAFVCAVGFAAAAVVMSFVYRILLKREKEKKSSIHLTQS